MRPRRDLDRRFIGFASDRAGLERLVAAAKGASLEPQRVLCCAVADLARQLTDHSSGLLPGSIVAIDVGDATLNALADLIGGLPPVVEQLIVLSSTEGTLAADLPDRVRWLYSPTVDQLTTVLSAAFPEPATKDDAQRVSARLPSVKARLSAAVRFFLLALLIGLFVLGGVIWHRLQPPDDVSPKQTTLLIDAITSPVAHRGTPSPQHADDLVPPDNIHVYQANSSSSDAIADLESRLDGLANAVDTVGSLQRSSDSTFRDEITAMRAQILALQERLHVAESDNADLGNMLRELHGVISKLQADQVRQAQRAREARRLETVARPQWVRNWGGVEMAGFPGGAFSVGDQVGEWKISDIDVAQQRVTVVSLRDPRREQTLTPTSSDQ